MKIILSKALRKEIKGLFLLEGISILLSCVWFIEDIGLMMFMCLYIVLVSTFAQGVIFASTYRLLTYAIDTENYIKSYLLKRQLCEINKQKEIYYVIFKANETRSMRREFILLSNQPFEYEEKDSIRMFPWNKKPLLVSYDIKTQIAMPYNDQTKLFFELDNWNRIEPK